MKIATERNGRKTVYGKNGRLRVSGNHLVNEKGEPVRLFGVSSHNMNSFPQFVNDDAIEFMADQWGMDIFRLAMYTAFADGDDGYADGSEEHREELEEMVIRSVRKCAEIGIYVMIDWHILFDYDPRMHQDMAVKFFDKMSALFAEYDNVIYEICNEPSEDQVWAVFKPETADQAKNWPDKKCTWENIKSYAETVIPVIRRNSPDSVIVCGTPTWSQRVDHAANAPLQFDNVMYALHFYASTHKQELRDKADYALSRGIAIYVTEYGICDAAGSGAIDYEETKKWNDWMERNSISCNIWNLSNKAETSAMIKPDCKKISSWTEDELTESGLYFKGLKK